MCKNKKDPKMHPMEDLKILFSDLIYQVVQQKDTGFVLCYQNKSNYNNFDTPQKKPYNWFNIIMILIFICVAFYILHNKLNL